MPKASIAILAPERDGHLPPVIAVLKKRNIPFFRMHLADFPHKATLSTRYCSEGMQESSLDYNGQKCDLLAITGVWNRRHSPPQASPEIVAYAHQFVEEEARHGLHGVWKSLDRAFWLNHLDANRAADNKPYQLHLAQQCGLRIPESLVTNNPAEVRQFFEECDQQMIYKAFGRNHVRSPQGLRYIFTSQVQTQDLEHPEMLEGIRTTAHFFQRLIPKRLELRVTIIGGTIFAAELYSQQTKDGQIDFRKAYADLSYGKHTLPPGLQKQLFHLMRTLHLEYAALDLIVTPGDEYIFLEANCSGQFGWIEDALRMPMSRTLVDVLVGEAPRVIDVV